MRLLRNPRHDMPLLSSRRPIRPRRQSRKSERLQQRFNVPRLHNLQFDMPLLPSRSLTRPRRRLRKNRAVKGLRRQNPGLLQPTKGRQSSVPTSKWRETVKVGKTQGALT